MLNRLNPMGKGSQCSKSNGFIETPKFEVSSYVTTTTLLVAVRLA